MDVAEEEADTWEVEVRHFVYSCFTFSVTRVLI